MLHVSRNVNHGRAGNDRNIKGDKNMRRKHTFVPCCYVDWNARRTGLGSGVSKGSEATKGTNTRTGSKSGTGSVLGTGTGTGVGKGFGTNNPEKIGRAHV